MNSDPILSSQGSSSSVPTPTETVLEGTKANRQQPIPPPSEPMQYRAIGLVHGCYVPSSEQFTQGKLLVEDGTQIEAVLLGRIISLLRNHIDLAQEHLWVVYPRTGQQEDNLHLQIVGVWEPENLTLSQVRDTSEAETEESNQSASSKQDRVEQQPEADLPTPEIKDGYFSVRGEVVFQSAADSQLVVKIKQAPRKESDKPKHFKLKLQGVLKTKANGQFWDFQVTRQADKLVVQQAKAIAVLPKPKPKKKFPPRQAEPGRPRNVDAPRPVRKSDSSSAPAVPKPVPKSSIPKPNKRPKPPQ